MKLKHIFEVLSDIYVVNISDIFFFFLVCHNYSPDWVALYEKTMLS